MKPQAETCREETLVSSECPKANPSPRLAPPPALLVRCIKNSVIMEQHLAPIKPSPHTRHAPLTALAAAAAAVGLSASLCASAIPSFSFILSAHLRLRASLPPPSLTPSASFTPHLFSAAVGFCFVCGAASWCTSVAASGVFPSYCFWVQDGRGLSRATTPGEFALTFSPINGFFGYRQWNSTRAVFHFNKKGPCLRFRTKLFTKNSSFLTCCTVVVVVVFETWRWVCSG